MGEIEAKIKEVERDTEFNKWKKKVLVLQVGEELEITNPKDRAMEGNILAWGYRRKKENLFFRKRTDGGQIFIVRDK